MKELIHIIENNSFTDIIQKLSAWNFTKHSELENLAVLRWMTAFRQYAFVKENLHCIEKNYFSQESKETAITLHLRLALQEGKPSKDIGDQEKNLPRWVSVFCKTGQDIAYPTTIASISPFMSETNTFSIKLGTVCLACKAPVYATMASDLLPVGSKDRDTWICPHCLALHAYDRSSIRDDIFSLFKQAVSEAPRDAKGDIETKNAMILVLMACALRPAALIRFGVLYSKVIGHLIVNTYNYIIDRLEGKSEPSLDYIGLEEDQGVPANAFMIKLWERMLPLTTFGSFGYKMIGGNNKNTFFCNKMRINSELFHNFDFHFPFTLQEHEEAFANLEKMGVPRDARFVCLLGRDDVYYTCKGENKDSCYAQQHRNFDIDDTQKAMEFLADNGYYVLRMGYKVSKELTWSNERIIDYASHFRSEFMDIWLFSHAHLTVTVGSGPDIIPIILKKPILFINFLPVGALYTLSDNTITLPKTLRDKNTNKLLPIERIMSSEIATTVHTRHYDDNSILIENNTEDEILDATKECIMLMNGGKRDEKIENLQKSFYGLIDKYRWNFVEKHSQLPELTGTPTHLKELRGKVSSIYLQKYKDDLSALLQNQ